MRLAHPIPTRDFKRNLAQGGPPRFDQYLLHFWEHGFNEILSLGRLPRLQRTGLSAYNVPPSLPIPRKPLNTVKNDIRPSSQGPSKCVNWGKEVPLYCGENQLINGEFFKELAILQYISNILFIFRPNGRYRESSKIHEVESWSQLLT